MAEKAITIKGLTAEIGDAGKAADVYKKISLTYGFGNVGTGYLGGAPALDINSLKEPQREEISKLIETAKGQAAEAKKADEAAAKKAAEDAAKANK